MSKTMPDDRRRQVREDVRLPGVALVLCESNVLAIEVWTRNLSAGGVSVLSREELQGDRMLLDLPLPEFSGKFVECEVRHRSQYDRVLMSGAEETNFVCGLKFGRIFLKEVVHESLLEAFKPPLSLPPVKSAVAIKTGEESLVPLMSAFGMVVVYASGM